MPGKTQQESENTTTQGKSLVNKSGEITKLVEWATQDANSVEELEALFGQQGVSYTNGSEITGDFQLITGDEKQLALSRLVGKKCFVIRWEFRTPSGGGNEYVTMHILFDGAGKFIVNDSGKIAMYGQLRDITDKRMAAGQPFDRATTGVLVERGIRKNKPYFYNETTKKAWHEGEDPGLKRAARDTFSFVF